MARLVKCVYCEKQFDREQEDFVPVKNRYAHTECAKKHAVKQKVINEIHEKMFNLLGRDYSKIKIDKQIKELLEDGNKTELGILKALNYWYDVKGNDPALANGGIRIVNYIYGESQDYWFKKEENAKRNLNIDIKKYLNPPVREIVVKPQPIRKPKKVKLFDIR